MLSKYNSDERGKWSGKKLVPDYDKSSVITTVPGSKGKKIKAAAENFVIVFPDT